MYVTLTNEGDDSVQAVRRDGVCGQARETSDWIHSAREVVEGLLHVQCPPNLVVILLQASRRVLVRRGIVFVSAVGVGLRGRGEVADKAEKCFDEIADAPLLDEADRAVRAEGLEVKSRRNGRCIVSVFLEMDVSQDRFHMCSTREAYIEQPPEDAEEGMVEVLLRPVYGTCDAAMAFDRLATEVTEGAGYVIDVSRPCVYRHRLEPLVAWSHGDDIIVAGRPHLVDLGTANLQEP